MKINNNYNHKQLRSLLKKTIELTNANISIGLYGYTNISHLRGTALVV